MPSFANAIEKQVFELAWEEAHANSPTSMPLEALSDAAAQRLEQYRSDRARALAWAQGLTGSEDPRIANLAYSLTDDIGREMRGAEFADTSQRNTVVINVFGGPGAGKTTMALEIAAELKKQGYSVEYAPEIAKEHVWTLNDPNATAAEIREATAALSGRYAEQRAMFKAQDARVKRLIGQCDFVVTDSPALLACAYLKPSEGAVGADEVASLEKAAMESYLAQHNLNVSIARSGSVYEQDGRVHDAAQAHTLDGVVEGLLARNAVPALRVAQGQVEKVVEAAKQMKSRMDGAKAPEHAGQEKVMTAAERKEKTMADENVQAVEEVQEQGGESARRDPSVSFHPSFIHPYTKTDKQGKEWDKAIVNLPRGTNANGVDLSGYSFDVFMSDRMRAAVASNGHDRVGVFLPVEDGKVRLFASRDPETGEYTKAPIEVDGWEVAKAVKAANVAYDEGKAQAKEVEKEAPSETIENPFPKEEKVVSPTPAQQQEAAKRSAEAQAKSGPVAERVKQH